MSVVLRYSLILLLAVLVSGCVCGYYAPESREVSIEEVPSKVIDSFRSRLPNAEILRVERITFKGRNPSYNFVFRQADGQVRTAGVNRKREVVVYEQVEKR